MTNVQELYIGMGRLELECNVWIGIELDFGG